MKTTEAIERDLGRLGENTFASWCSSVGLIANKSDVDITGWDYIVESSLNASEHTPLDLVATPLECKIQVKSTDHKKGKIQIKLDNLLRLTKYNGPAYICILEFDSSHFPRSAYLKEIDKKIIEQTLLKLRKLDSKGDTDIHKKSITIKYANKDSFQTNGEGLKSSIIRTLNSESIEKYIKVKSQYISSIGYSETNTEGTFTIESEDPLSDIIDLTLGLKEKIKVSKFTAHDLRFGIKSREPTITGIDGDISIELNDRDQGKLTFAWPAASEHIVFDATILIPQAFMPCLPLNKTKIRVKTRFLDFLMDFSSGKTNISFTYPTGSEKHLLCDLYNHAKLVHLVITEESAPNIKLQFGNNPPIKLSTSNFNNSSSNYEDATFFIINTAWMVAATFNISKQVTTSLDELINNQESSENILKLNSNEGLKNPSITGRLKKSYPIKPKMKGALVTTSSAILGNKTIICISSHVGVFSSEIDNNQRIIFNSKKLAQHKKHIYVFDENEQINIDELSDISKSLQNELDGEDRLVVSFTLHPFHDGEKMVGYSQHFDFTPKGYFITPADVNGNNTYVFASKSAIDSMSFY